MLDGNKLQRRSERNGASHRAQKGSFLFKTSFACIYNGEIFCVFSQLCSEFGKLASEPGRVIISELFLDESKKSIPPITARVGGVAGGMHTMMMKMMTV